jgi:hypothetical protein
VTAAPRASRRTHCCTSCRVRVDQRGGSFDDVAHRAGEIDAALHMVVGQAADLSADQVRQRRPALHRQTHARIGRAEPAAAGQAHRHRRCTRGDAAFECGSERVHEPVQI